ncbi:hypothetical protein DLJ49_03550 [Rhodovulum sp. 12E13]|uniref:hypothetical protein n=1 Tax=Rhodovulum sp. 12E13 TaxID=2203891 RepID=UPI000E1ABDD0|nr:hypothetical protein [Rhodovulum sp. 12E13]RDC74381.1 hypothetical protein DLJ49_03550 [Rhodovulum sp. 12E13]
MLLSLLLGAAAGWALTRTEPVLARLIAAALKAEVALDPRDFRVLTLLALLALAALVIAASGVDSSLFAALLGAALGHFGPDLYRFLRDPNAVPDDARWDGRMREPGSRRVHRAQSSGATGPHGAPDEADPDAETLRAVSAELEGKEVPPAPPPGPTDQEEPRR